MLEVRPAGPDSWDDVATVMGERGDPARCFCQYFRLRGRHCHRGLRRRHLHYHRVPSSDLYRGPLSVFLDAGFTEVSRTSPQWVLVRRTL